MSKLGIEKKTGRGNSKGEERRERVIQEWGQAMTEQKRNGMSKSRKP